MRKIKLLTLLLLPMIVLATGQIKDKTEEQKSKDEAENMKILESLGLPLPGSGIKLVPRSMLKLSKEVLEKGAIEEKQMKTLGYAIENTPRPMELLHFHTYAKQQFKNYIKTDSETSTHLRQTKDELKLAFEFKGVPEDEAIKPIGYVVQGGFHQDMGGWSGAVEIFDHSKIGSCAYAVMNVKASNTAAELAQEDVAYTINNKATIIKIKGNKSSGFLYRVKWYDPENFHELECANLKYSLQIKNAVISLAKEIDNY